MARRIKETTENQTNEGLLVNLNDYLAAGVHIGMKFKSGFMKKYIFKTREDGLGVLNVSLINKKIAVASKMMAKYKPEEILVLGRRDSAKKPISMFSKITGIRAVPGRYYPGLITNPSLKNFTEAKLIIASDPWSDRNAIKDGYATNIPIISLCDTNNNTQKIDLVIPCNNKGKKSLATVFFILAREYLKNTGVIKDNSDFEYEIKQFFDERKKKKNMGFRRSNDRDYRKRSNVRESY